MYTYNILALFLSNNTRLLIGFINFIESLCICISSELVHST